MHFPVGECHSCFWSWLLRGWHGVKGHNSILKLAPLKNPNTIKRHIPEAKNNHKTRHFLRHEGRGQELWGYKSLCEGAVRRLCGKGCGCKALAVCLVCVLCPRPSISTEQWCSPDTGSTGLGLSQDIHALRGPTCLGERTRKPPRKQNSGFRSSGKVKEPRP